MKLANIIVKEGGFALKSVGVRRINRDDIPATIHYVSQISGIPIESFHPLGSVGKTPTSGDIDLAISTKEFNPKKIHQRMIDMLGEDNCTYQAGTKVASYAVPIAGDVTNNLVQVDFMYVDNPEYAKFSYHSPGTDSRYKGAVRTMLLMGVAASYSEPGTDYFEFDPETGELIVRAGRTLDLNSGLRRIFQYRPKDKKGTRYLKNMKTITPQEFKQLFPDVEIRGDEVIVDNPSEILTILFGRGVTARDVNTAEQVIELIKSKFNKQKQQLIFQKAAERAQSVVNKMELPPEIMEYMK